MKSPTYRARKTLARLRKEVITYCQEAYEHEDKVADMTLDERIEDFKLYIKEAEIK